MQIDFWPEDIKIRDIDRVDVSTIDDWNRYKETDNVARSWSFSDITEGKYFIYKTGGKNPYLPDEVEPIFFMSVPARKNSSTKSNSVVVLPVPGGPSIIVFIRKASPDISLG